MYNVHIMYAIIGTPWNTPVDVSGFHLFLHIPQQTLVCLYLPSLETHQSWPRPRAPVLFKFRSTLADTCPSKTLDEKIWWDPVYIRENHGNLPNILLCGLCCLSHERLLEMYLSYLQYLVSAQCVFTFLIFRHSLLVTQPWRSPGLVHLCVPTCAKPNSSYLQSPWRKSQ